MWICVFQCLQFLHRGGCKIKWLWHIRQLDGSRICSRGLQITVCLPKLLSPVCSLNQLVPRALVHTIPHYQTWSSCHWKTSLLRDICPLLLVRKRRSAYSGEKDTSKPDLVWVNSTSFNWTHSKRAIILSVKLSFLASSFLPLVVLTHIVNMRGFLYDIISIQELLRRTITTIHIWSLWTSHFLMDLSWALLILYVMVRLFSPGAAYQI